MIVESARSSGLQVQLGGFTRSQVDILECVLVRIGGRIGGVDAGELWPIEADGGAGTVCAIRICRRGSEVCAWVTRRPTKPRVRRRDLIMNERMVEDMVTAQCKVGDLEIRTAHAGVEGRTPRILEVVLVLLPIVTEV